MATIYRFDEFHNSEDRMWDKDDFAMLFQEEAKRLEAELIKRYSDIELSEKESQDIYAKIMRQILRMENTKR